MSTILGESPIIQAYANALFNAGQAQGVTRDLCAEAKALLEIMEKEPNFKDFVEGPHISRQDKHSLVTNVFKDKIHTLLINLIYLAIDKGRGEYIDEILIEYLEVVERSEGIYPAQLTTARELGFDDRLKLKTALEKFTNTHLRIDYEVKPEITGGLIFRFQDVLIDGSIRTKLTKLRRKLVGGLGVLD